MDEIIYFNTNDITNDACRIIDSAQETAYHAVNATLVVRNWLLGKRISEEELKGADRAEYGQEVVKALAQNLTAKYGRGYSERSLYKFWRFYKQFPNILPMASAKSEGDEKVPIVSAKLLSWSHYDILQHVNDKEARDWYANEAYNQIWSYKTLQRNISSQYYYRIIKTQDKDAVRSEMEQITAPLQNKLEFIKNPVIAEFLGMQSDTSYLESDLEQCIIDNLQ